MTDMGFGYYSGDLGENQDGVDVSQQAQQEPQGQQQNGLRQYLKSLEEKTKTQQAQLDALLAESRRNKVADVLEAKGYPRGASALYTGDPDKVDEWLASAAPLLAKRPDAPADGGTGAGGTGDGAGTGTVSPDGQAQLQQFQQAGQGAAPPAGSDAEQSAAMARFTSAEELTKYLADNGNVRAQYWTG